MGEPDNDKGGVIPFRARAGEPPPVEGTERHAGDGGEDDDRHRTITNALSLLVLALLIGGGVWLAVTIADIRKNQDCVLSGRRNCAAVEVQSRDRW